MLSREYGAIAGAGGVKDVTRQLSEALARSGRSVNVVLPLYGFIDPKKLGFSALDISFEIDMPYVDTHRREYVRVFSNKPAGSTEGEKEQAPGVTIYLIDAQRFLEKKSIYTYTAEEEVENPFHRQGSGHYDYFAMNVLLQKAALALIIKLGERPDIIHCHDGHTAMLPAMIREIEGYRHYFSKTGAVVTIHNAGRGYHQEVGDLPFAEAITGLPAHIIKDNLLDEMFDPFLAASQYAVLNTVSENYARELRETDDDALTGWLGHRLLGRGVKLAGVTNGIDPAEYDLEHPEKLGLPAGFSPLTRDLTGKKNCRERLVDDLADNAVGKKTLGEVSQTGFLHKAPEQPLFTFVGRLTAQKGMDKLLGALETLLPLDRNFQVLILGSGAKEIESTLLRLATTEEYEGRICVLRGYSPELANKIYAAGDFFLIPSQYEPCGLTDFMAQLFGNLPIVHHIGGLVKVKNGVTGFSYLEHKSAALMGAMQRAIKVYRKHPEKITDMQQAAVECIHQHYTWDMILVQYLKLYQQALRQTT